MSKAIITNEYLTDIADAIRYKNGSTDTYLPSEMASAIRLISGGENDYSWVVGDGDTYLHLKIPSPARSTISLLLELVGTIDWGDGSAVERSSDSTLKRYVHTYEVEENGDDFIVHIAASTLALGGNTMNLFGYLPYDVDYLPIYSNTLQKAEIGNAVTELRSGAFMFCTSLTDIVLPEEIESITGNAFWNCINLRYIYIPSSITEIEFDTFKDCHSLKTVDMYATQIGENAFENCYALQNISMRPSLTSIGTGAFKGCISLPKVQIMEGVTVIHPETFYDCNCLTSLEVSEFVTAIGARAFANCTSMKEYHFYSEIPPTLANVNAFLGIPSDCIIYVPADSLSAYQSANNWSAYSSYMQGELI